MTHPSQPATGYPAPPPDGYPPPQQRPPPYTTSSNNYYYTNHNPYLEPPPPYLAPRATFFRRFLAGLISFFIVFSTIFIIVWLIIRPRVPSFTVDSLYLSSLNLSSSSEISGSWNIHFTVSNPNHKLHLYYDEIEARLYYKSSFIAQNQLAPFDQGTKNLTAMTATLVAASAYINSDSLEGINGDKLSGSVKFDVRVLGTVRSRVGRWRARRRFLRVSCDDLPVSFRSNTSNGTLTGGPKRCDVVI